MSDVKALPQKLAPFFAEVGHGRKERPQDTLQQRAQALAPTALLCFAVADEECALPLLMVQEICVLRAITKVPRARPATLGITSLRGEVVPVVDLAAVLGLGAMPQGPRTARGVLLADERGPLALHVRAVRGVVRLAHKDVSPRPFGLKMAQPNLVAGLGRTAQGLVTLLDGAALLQHLERLW